MVINWQQVLGSSDDLVALDQATSDVTKVPLAYKKQG